MTREELEQLIGGMDPQAGLDWYRNQYGQLSANTGLVGGGSPAYEWQRMNEAYGNMEYGPQIGTQGQLPGAPEGMQYWGTFDNNGNLTDVRYQNAPERSWYQGIGPALPVLGALGAAGVSNLLGGAGAGNAGWVSGFDLAGGGMLEGMGAGAEAAAAGAMDSAIFGQTTGAAGAGAAGAGAAGAAGAGAAGAAGSSLLGGLGNRALGALAGAALGGVSSANAPDSETVTSQRTLDPRIDAQITGPNGFLPQLNTAIGQGPGPGLTNAFNTAQSYLGANGTTDLGTMADTIRGQMNSNIAAPTMQAATLKDTSVSKDTVLQPVQQGKATTLGTGATPTVKAGEIDFSRLTPAGGGAASAGVAGASQAQAASLLDPSQQRTNLAPGFQDYLYSDQGQNPYLTAALQRGANQASNAYGDLLRQQGENFRENILGGIQDNAIRAGGIGGARQGIAQGIAAREQIRAQQQMAERLGTDLNSAMVGAQSQNFQQGRQLGAGLLGTLSGQQYGQEQQRAGLTQGANLANAQLGTQASIANAGNQTQASVASANNATQAGVANQNAMASLLGQQAALNQGANLATSGYTMQGLLADQAAQNNMATANMGQANAYNLAAGQLGQANNQFNAGQANVMNQYGTGLQQQANANNLQSSLATNTLNANVANQGVGNMWNAYTGMTNLANAGQNYDFNRLTTGMQAFAPYAQMYSGQTQTSPLYNNVPANLLGGAVVGAQLANNLFR